MIRIEPLPQGLTMRDPAALIATGLGSGRLYPAPGTWGTLAAWLLAMIFGKAFVLAGLAAALIAGIWAIQRYQSVSQSHDSGMIVIDEWAGVWLAMLFATFLDQAVLAFILFRVFDIWKPWPIRYLDENMKGAWGVMADDLAAGLLAGLCVYGYGQWIYLF